MFYVKNVPGWERAARVAMGVAFVAAAVAYFGATPTGWIVGAIGAMAAMTGLVGFCPCLRDGRPPARALTTLAGAAARSPGPSGSGRR